MKNSGRTWALNAAKPAPGPAPVMWGAGLTFLVSILPKMDRVMLFELSGCLDGHARRAFSSKTLLDRICSHVVWATCFASVGDE